MSTLAAAFIGVMAGAGAYHLALFAAGASAEHASIALLCWANAAWAMAARNLIREMDNG